LSSTDAFVFRFSPYITKDVNYDNLFGFNAGTGVTTPAAATTLVISPTMTVCSACHTSDLALTHMKQNGGSFYTARSTALATTETCELCHATGRVADIKAMHAK
jgi:OmcA/MtrC family decaheme c-type cytochrome